MQEVVLIIGGIAYSIFIIQFIMSLFGYDADIDIDVDLDGNTDFSVSDLVSFKGLIHFIMGSSTYLYTHIYLGNPINIYTWIITVVVGIVFVIGLYYIYKLCMKLQHVPSRETDISDRYVTIIRHVSELSYVGSATINGAYEEFDVESSIPLEEGKQYKISKFNNNKIYI